MKHALMACVSALAFAPIVSTTVLAQTAEQQPVNQGAANASDDTALLSRSAALEEIVVTAQRRSESLQQTAITAAVMTGSDLQDRHIDNLSQLQLSTPSLSVGDAGVTASVNIRGIGLGVSSPAVPNGVALYRDGVFQGPLLTSEPLFDMAAVEVLRGPQGTFVGSNSTGGAVMYRSVDPTFDRVEGYVQGWVGNYSDVGLQGAVNLPITHNLAARLAFNVETRDSYFDQTGDVGISGSKRDPGNMSQRNIRLGLLWEPTDTLKIISKTAYNRENTDGLAHVMSTSNPYYDGRPLRYNLTYNTPDTLYNQRGFRQSLQGDYTFADGIVARVILGYTRVRSPYIDDFDSSDSLGTTTAPAATGVFANTAFEKTISQEFNLISPSGGALEWTVGVFHMWDRSQGDIDISQVTAPTLVSIRAPTIKKSIAGFGQLNYNLTSALQIQVGIRYTDAHARTFGTVTLYGLAPFPISTDQSARESDNAFSGKLGLSWKINPDHFLYAFAAKGYKSGGINGPSSPNFGPETVYDYEAGLKSTFAGGKVRTQINGFYMDYRDLQLTSYIPPAAGGGLGGGNGVVNAGNSKIYGFEAQAQAQFGGLGLDANVAYIHSKLGRTLFIDSNALPGSGNVPLGPQCTTGNVSNPPICFDYVPFTRDLSGGPNPYSPKWTINLSAYYRIGLTERATLTPRVDFSHIGGQYQTILSTPANYIPAHNLINASLAFKTDDWTLEAYGTNLGNKTYIVGYTYGPAYFLGRPREYGLRVTRRF